MGFQVRVSNRSKSLILWRPRRRLNGLNNSVIKSILPNGDWTSTHYHLFPFRLFANMMR